MRSHSVEGGRHFYRAQVEANISHLQHTRPPRHVLEMRRVSIQRPHRVGPRLLIVPISLSVSVMHDLSSTMRALAERLAATCIRRGVCTPVLRVSRCLSYTRVSFVVRRVMLHVCRL